MAKDPLPGHLRQYAIRFERVPEGQPLRFDVCDGNLMGLRSKLGGEPDWIQCGDSPTCEGCGEPMRFVGQLDSIEHGIGRNPHRQPFDEREFMFGDVGMIYIFFCFGCLHPVAVFESY